MSEERTTPDLTGELIACLEVLADWVDQTPVDDAIICGEFFNAVWQVIELTQLLFSEHQALIEQMNEFIGALALAKEEATKGTKLVIANAGDMKRYIQEDGDV